MHERVYTWVLKVFCEVCVCEIHAETHLSLARERGGKGEKGEKGGGRETTNDSPFQPADYLPPSPIPMP